MTKDEIKKALEICTDIYAPCNGCPYEKCTNCDNTLHTDALNVIVEQEREIERLRDDYAKLQEQFAQYQMATDKEIKAQIKQAKIDILNFLKDGYEVDISTSNDCDMVVRVEDIDELIEEI